jgi:hypothetical protein
MKLPDVLIRFSILKVEMQSAEDCNTMNVLRTPERDMRKRERGHSYLAMIAFSAAVEHFGKHRCQYDMYKTFEHLLACWLGPVAPASGLACACLQMYVCRDDQPRPWRSTCELGPES